VDRPLAIGGGQTISQPYVVAAITQALNPASTDTVLEVGAGSGYQAAVLGRLARRVIGVELVPELALAAASALARVGILNVEIREGDGTNGCPEEAPFECVVVSAAASRVPEALLEQLAEGGRMAIPLETGEPDRQDLMLITKLAGKISSRVLLPVRFVPLVER
jgi:protein-L-isoaspartate(D-aspartate) O-methyltransferase